MAENNPKETEATKEAEAYKNIERYRPLQVFVYVVVSVIGIATIMMMAFPLFRGDFLAQIADAKVARGMITYVFVLGTTSIAVVLTLAILLRQDEHIEQRYRLGREVLSILIGVVGTIIGFYFGAAEGGNSSNQETRTVQERKIEPKVELDANINNKGKQSVQK